MQQQVTTQFPWTGDVDRGAWLHERLAPSISASSEPALAPFVPSGFPALVRIFHPWRRDRPTTGAWEEYYAHWRSAGGLGLPVPEIITEPGVRWFDVAQAFGTDFAGDTRAPDLLGPRPWGSEPADVETDSKIASTGWRYSLPEEGSLDSDVLALAAAVLVAHTATPDDGIAAVWAGYGGLMSSTGSSVLTAGGPGDSAEPGSWGGPVTSVDEIDHEALTRQLLFQPQAEPGTGILSREAATGPQLLLPDREYVCFEAGISAFAQESWPARAPWIEDPASGWVQSPNLIWPEGREWFLISEIDLDSTLVACALTCAEALEAHPGIEAKRITRDTWVF